jgi:glycosyltransferase involved in cell wall biosynthesis
MLSLPAALLNAGKQRTLVVLSQVYVPDPAAVGQYMHDVAAAMVRRGWQVVVIAADRGYEQPEQNYARYEQRDGVHIMRVPFASFGKRSVAVRLVGGGVFVSEAVLLAAALPRIDRVLVSTSPPMCALAGLALSRLRRAPLVFWAMDINPDQIVATGRFSPRALPVRALDWMNRQTLTRARRAVTLDRFMAQRLAAKLDVRERLVVLPLWSQVDASLAPLRHTDNPFRREHGFGGGRVVMYSGNLSPVHPIATCLEAARALQDDPRLLFVFIGGGLGRTSIEHYVSEHRLRNVRWLPYQPLAQLRLSLSAADLHLVSMGDEMVGIVHPCKIYTAMAVARPVFALGPCESHLGDLVRHHDIGWQVAHGDTPAATAALLGFLATPLEELDRMGLRAQRVVVNQFGKEELLSSFCEQLES